MPRHSQVIYRLIAASRNPLSLGQSPPASMCEADAKATGDALLRAKRLTALGATTGVPAAPSTGGNRRQHPLRDPLRQ
jgi:hypothetical protein